LASLVHARPEETVAGLHDYLTHLVDECAALHGAIVQSFFSHLAWRPWEAEEAEAGFTLVAPGEWRALVMSQQQQ
jgi:hypothetical protein